MKKAVEAVKKIVKKTTKKATTKQVKVVTTTKCSTCEGTGLQDQNTLCAVCSGGGTI